MKSMHEIIKQKFDWYVTALPTYTDQESMDVLTDIVQSSDFINRVSVMDNVKGSKLIKLLTSSPTLQGAASCGWTPSGGAVLSDVTLSTKRLKIQEEYCNEDLNDTWMQLFKAAGANVEDKEMPMEDILLAYYIRRAAERTHDVVINVDTASGDANLAHVDGLVKLWDADASLVTATYSGGGGTITDANAVAVFKTVEAAIPAEVRELGPEIICGRESAQEVLNNIYNDKDFASTIEFTEQNGNLSFILPSTTTRVRSVQQLNGTNKVYAVPYQYVFYGTDLEDDMSGFEVKYNEHDEKLRVGVKWYGGVNYVFPQYFVKLDIAGAS